MGSEKWVDIHEHETTEQCLIKQKQLGHKILVTTLNSTSMPVHQWDFTQPTTIVMGNERDGVSPKALELADATCYIPMHGFTESYNISVATSMILYEAYQQRVKKFGKNSELSQDQVEWLKAHYYYRCAKNKDKFADQVLESTRLLASTS